MGKTGMEVTVLGFGGAEIGYGRAAQAEVDTLLNAALDAGLNVIDTAECYDIGEELVGNAVSHRRSDYYLFTKCGHASGLPLSDWDPALLEQSIERSLKRLKTDCVDLIQLHSCSEDILRRGDAIAAVQKARDQGKARFIGYSGDAAAAKYAVDCGAFDVLQTSISIADQQALSLTVPVARERQMGVIAKRPIANAVFATNAPNGYTQAYYDRLKALDYPFVSGNVTQAISIALRFTLSQPGVHTAIVGTTKPERWRQNADLLATGPLSTAESEAIRRRWHAVAGPDWNGQT